jgi:hypothetical protein
MQNNISLSERIISFLRGEGVDEEGRTINDIWQFSNDKLEYTHNYIQWLFPLLDWSEMVPGAPFIEESDVEVIRNDETIQDNFIHSLAIMQRFYTNNDEWLNKGDHNHYRITRIIKSISLLNSKENAEEFYRIILDKVEEKMPVTFESLEYWKEAMS